MLRDLATPYSSLQHELRRAPRRPAQRMAPPHVVGPAAQAVPFPWHFVAAVYKSLWEGSYRESRCKVAETH
jgi:hypothetical protein